MEQMQTEYWIDSTTLGKKKNFIWRIDEQFNLYIKRESFQSVEVIKADEVDRINAYVIKNNWVDLANNVEKLSKGIEKEGIGKFMYDNIKNDTKYAQLSSYLGPILVESNIWIYNGKKRGIKFKSCYENWRERITER